MTTCNTISAVRRRMQWLCPSSR